MAYQALPDDMASTSITRVQVEPANLNSHAPPYSGESGHPVFWLAVLSAFACPSAD
jgi:hypothetical protein